MYSEEILVKLGLDKRSLTSGLSESKREVRDFSGIAGESFEKVHHSARKLRMVLHGLGIIAVVAGVKELVGGVTEMFSQMIFGSEESRKKINAVADAIDKARSAARGEAERSSKMDLAAAPDDKAKLELLKEQAEKQKEIHDQAEANAREYEKFQAMLEKVKLGEMDSKDLPQHTSEWFQFMEEQEALFAKSGNDYRETLIDIRELQKKMDDEALRAAKERGRVQAENAKNAFKAYENYSKAKSDLETSKSDRTKISLDELAGLDPRRFGRYSDARQEIFQARQIEQLESDARNIGFSDDYRKFASDRALELRNGIKDLRDSDRYPMRTLEEHAKTTAEVLTSFKNTGVPIQDE